MADEFIAKRIIEGILFMSGSPLTIKDLASITGMKPSLISFCLKELVEDYDTRGIQIKGWGGAYRMLTNPEIAPYLGKLRSYSEGSSLSRAALETLSVVAYCQPVTRREIEEQRGVNVDSALGKLLEMKLVQVKGRAEAPGKPVLFGTTRRFLDSFGLGDLKELPFYDEFRKRHLPGAQETAP
jgi:segregation and condensation protein B